MMIDIHLERCAHCDGLAMMCLVDRSDPPFSYKALRVGCTKCGIGTQYYPTDGYYGCSYTPEFVAAVWNKRASKASPVTLLEERRMHREVPPAEPR